MNEFSFSDLLPGSVKDDPKFRAASECLDSLFRNFREKTRDLLIYSRIGELPEQTLDDLAWQWNWSYSYGYDVAKDIGEKREIVENMLRLHKYKGTRWALETIGDILKMPVTIVEWWENVEHGTNLEPYEFEIFVDMGTSEMETDFYVKATRIINAMKNARSHLRGIRDTITPRVEIHLSGRGYQALSGTVRPGKST